MPSPGADSGEWDKWLAFVLEDGRVISGVCEEVEKLFSIGNARDCNGSRLRPESRAVKINGTGHFRLCPAYRWKMRRKLSAKLS